MSDQVYDDPGAEDSHEADIEAGFDDAGHSTAPAGVPGSAQPEEEKNTSHEADVAAGQEDADEHAGDADADDRRLGLR